MRHFDAHVLYDHRTNRHVPNAPVTITDTATGQTLDTFDADGQPLTLVSNERGWVPPFRADALLVRASAPGATTRPLIAYEAVIITPARQALSDAIAAYSDARQVWSESEPADTSALWVHPVTGVVRQWVDARAELEALLAPRPVEYIRVEDEDFSPTPDMWDDPNAVLFANILAISPALRRVGYQLHEGEPGLYSTFPDPPESVIADAVLDAWPERSGWATVTDPDVVAAGQAYADAVGA